jgi:5'-3' exonuclease
MTTSPPTGTPTEPASSAPRASSAPVPLPDRVPGEASGFEVHLIDGTYELFRHFFAVPRRAGADGAEVGAVGGVLASVLRLLEEGATHLGVATDHVIESFRNHLWAGYKTGAGIDPVLRSQFEPLEDALDAMGVRTWPMVEYEADDALAAAAARASAAAEVSRVLILTPDKDLGQCIVGERVVQVVDRKTGAVRDLEGLRVRFGVAPESIPDYLALVGDSADGFPGLPGWGAKSTAAVLARFVHLEAIPLTPSAWGVPRAPALNAVLRGQWNEALLFRELATLRRDIDVFETVEELRWRGPTTRFERVASALGAPELGTRAARIAARGGHSGS